MRKDHVYLGQILVERGIITPEQLQKALEEQRKTGHKLGVTLVNMGVVEPDALLPALAEKLGIEHVVLKNSTILPDVLGRLPAKAVNYYKVFPLKFEHGLLTVAMSNPWEVSILDDLSTVCKDRIQPVLADEKDINDAIREYYGVGAETVERMMSDQQIAPTETIAPIDESGSEASISYFLNQILMEANQNKATDIHIEPFGSELRIRYRIDGVLADARVPENIRYFQDALISRIKILSNLNIAERRLPQDGRFKVKIENTTLDLRVSFLPTSFGESCVIRLLNAFKLYNLEELGFLGEEQKYIQQLLEKPHGVIFLTGPTGSGKTTTLYSCLAALNKDDTKIITVEDPVEYQLKGIVQIQTNAQIGLTFATALRSILRNDPDVIMIGEVRDFETAQIAIQMSLTGHLVFSTLHTNDAASGVTRLIDIGVEPYLIASSVECFIAQRLVRLLCSHCKHATPLTDNIRRDFDLNSASVVPSVIYEAVGCPKCRMSGYTGRQAISEFLMLNDDIRSMILKRTSSGEIQKAAIAAGMKTLRQQGWEKVCLGLTSPSEVLRVTQND